MTKDLSVAICAMTSIDHFETNVESMVQLLREINKPCDLVFFPEMSVFFQIKADVPMQGWNEQFSGWSPLREWAQQNQCAIHLGSVPWQNPEGRVFNRTLLIDEQGKLHPGYSKMHLFDVEAGDGRQYRESDSVGRGEAPHTFLAHGWKFGESICYDLRFPELYLWYASQGVDALLIPAAFTVPTGQAHWEVLTRARAIENQVYVIAPAQGGEHKGFSGSNIRKTFGHGLIISPRGEVLAETSRDNPIAYASLSKEQLNDFRAKVPMKNHRHPFFSSC